MDGKRTIALALCSWFFAGFALAQITTTRVANGLARPLFVTHARGDYGRVFIVEQFSGSTGRIRILNIPDNTLNATPYLSISPVRTANEEGLLGLAFHPNFANNGYFWVYYTNTAGNNQIVRYQADPPYLTSTTANASSATLVFTISHPTNTNHNGGWIAFAPGDTQGYLYVATGDGGSANDPPGNAQNINAVLGKMLRIDIDGPDNIPGNGDDDEFPADATRNYAVPPGNPFVGVAGADEVLYMGLRNPWRSGFDRDTGDLYIGDVGQNSIEEIDFVAAGTAITPVPNFGWRCMEGNNCTGLTGCTCLDASLTNPIHTYNHSLGRCSVTGGYVYRGCAIPALNGSYFFADYCGAQIYSFAYSGSGPAPAPTDRTAQLAPGGGLSIATITSFGEDAHGELYICDQGGEVFKIVPTSLTDCNANGIADACDIASGASEDCNNDGIPDECQGGSGPAVLNQPQSQAACAGASVTLSVTATGLAPLAYQWRKGGVDIGGANAPTYAINPVTAADAGSYDCVVTNACGSATSDAAMLTVLVGCDANCDGSVNPFDVQPFLDMLVGNPRCSGCAGDANGDGTVNPFDVNSFLACFGL